MSAETSVSESRSSQVSESFWPSKDAYEAPAAAPAADLPRDHEFTRPCPWCGRPLVKRHAKELFVCRTCGWRG